MTGGPSPVPASMAVRSEGVWHMEPGRMPAGPVAEALVGRGAVLLLAYASSSPEAPCTLALAADAGSPAAVYGLAEAFASAAGPVRRAGYGAGSRPVPGAVGMSRAEVWAATSGPEWLCAASTLWGPPSMPAELLWRTHWARAHPDGRAAADPFTACFLALRCGDGGAAVRELSRHGTAASDTTMGGNDGR